MAVDGVGDVVALGDQHHVVPIAGLMSFFKSPPLSASFSLWRLLSASQSGLLAAIAHRAAAAGDAGLVVDRAVVALLGVAVGLIAADAMLLFGSRTFERNCRPEFPSGVANLYL